MLIMYLSEDKHAQHPAHDPFGHGIRGKSTQNGKET